LNLDNWIQAFFKSLKELEDQTCSKSDSEWTQFIGCVINSVAEKVDCYAAMRRSHPNNGEYSGEYLNIDAIFIPEAFYDSKWEKGRSKDWDPFVLPAVAIEFENSYDYSKIMYCIWKMICLRTSLRVLISYQANAENVVLLKTYVEKEISKRKLMEGEKGDLLIIIGDDTKGDEITWEEYFKIFLWKGQKLNEYQAALR